MRSRLHKTKPKYRKSKRNSWKYNNKQKYKFHISQNKPKQKYPIRHASSIRLRKHSSPKLKTLNHP
jgi:hypothetical protein